MHESSGGLVVAVTGPTGDIGAAFLRALDKDPNVGRIIGMARRPFDPTAQGLTKVDYRKGDVLERASVDELVADADVVVHLAFIILGTPEESRSINLQGSRNVFEATFDAGVRRLVYASSVAAYGFHDDHPEVITEEVAARGSKAHYYSRHKAEVEELLHNLHGAAGKKTDVYVFRPCTVAGPTALMLIEEIPYVRIGQKLPGLAKKVVGSLPLLRPVLPDPGLEFQLVHEGDVASALVAGVRGQGEPGAYNLAGAGTVRISDLVHALGWYSVPVPDIALDTTAAIVSRLPYMPAQAAWVNAMRVPVVVDTTKARAKLGWCPRHDALDTLAQTVAAARAQSLLSLKERDLARAE